MAIMGKIGDVYTDDLVAYDSNTSSNIRSYENGYKQGATDMENAKQIIIDGLLEQIKELEKKVISRPQVLYAIEDKIQGNIIFNARGGCYKDLTDAQDKIARLTKENGGRYDIVEYHLS